MAAEAHPHVMVDHCSASPGLHGPALSDNALPLSAVLCSAAPCRLNDGSVEAIGSSMTHAFAKHFAVQGFGVRCTFFTMYAQLA